MDTSTLLSLDPAQEAILGAGMFAPDAIDQMTFDTIARRWSAFTILSWTPAQSAYTTLQEFGVYPGMVGVTGTTIQPTALAYAAFPFQYWRGGIEYKIVVVKSNYHSGRLAIQFDPISGGIAPTQQSEVYTHILDITEGSEFTFRVNWAQNKSYKEMSLGFDVEAHGPTIIYNTTGFNGAVRVSVMNELVSPDGVSGVELIIYTRAAPDIDFQGPKVDGDLIQDLTFYAQSGEEEIVDLVGHLDMETSHVLPSIHFGERIVSARDLVKRFSYFRTVAQKSYPTGFTTAHYRHTALPAPGGITPISETAFRTVAAAGNNFSYMTHMMYFTAGYLGWRGSVRNKVYVTQVNEASGEVATSNFTMKASRGWQGNLPTPDNFLNVTTTGTTAEDLERASVLQHDSLNAGGNLCTKEVSGLLEYAVPWYNQANFSILDTSQITDNQGPNNAVLPDMNATVQIETIKTGAAASATMKIDHYVAAGDDFNLIWFQGAPAMNFATFTP